MTEPSRPRRWLGFGELIGLAALIISGLGVWISWKSASRNEPTRVIEQRQAIPLNLIAKPDDDGRALVIAAVEPSHALESMAITVAGQPPLTIGSDGRLAAGDVEPLLRDRKDEAKGTHTVPVRVDARYVEAGADRRRVASYVLRYRWEGGGLFSGRSLRLLGMSRS